MGTEPDEVEWLTPWMILYC